MATYDKYYNEDKQYFGKANKVLIEFFTSYKSRGSLVDLGAGQGRNSIPLSALGYDVTAVDVSKVGLNQITDLYPNIKTECTDIYKYNVENYDFILMDSMLHFYKKDFDKETKLVKDIFDHMKSDSVYVNCMILSKHSHLVDIINGYDSLNVLSSQEFLYDNKMKYHFISVCKS